MVTQLEPDILECEVKWALGSITSNKASGGDGIPAELFKILKDDAVQVSNLENSAVATVGLLFCYWVAGALYVFWIVIPYLIYAL